MPSHRGAEKLCKCTDRDVAQAILRQVELMLIKGYATTAKRARFSSEVELAQRLLRLEANRQETALVVVDSDLGGHPGLLSEPELAELERPQPGVDRERR